MRKFGAILLALSAPAAAFAAEPPKDDATRIIELETELSLLKIQVEYLAESKVNSHSSATIDPLQPGFGFINSGMVPLAVSVSDVAPYADGARITLNIGNPSTATIPDARVIIKYGQRQAALQKDTPLAARLKSYNDWNTQLRTKETPLTEGLAPGTWNEIAIALPGIKPDALGYLDIQIQFDSLILRK